MTVTLELGTFTTKSGENYDCIILRTKTGLKISIVDFKAVQRVRDIITLGNSLGVPPAEL